MSVPDPSRVTRYLTVALRWLLITFVVFALTTFGGLYLIDHILPKVYAATAVLQVPPSDLVVPAEGSTPEPVAFQPEFENTIRSPDILLSVIKDLDLDKTWAKQVDDANQDELPDVDALTHLNKMLKLDYKLGTNIVDITVSSDTPTAAADIANAIADRYKTLRDDEADYPPQESPVRIISRAEIPEEPSKPHKTRDLIVTIVAAGFLSITAASFVEIIFLFSRAAERTDN
jgi:capsular polysaccharide biosynthesis protein